MHPGMRKQSSESHFTLYLADSDATSLSKGFCEHSSYTLLLKGPN